MACLSPISCISSNTKGISSQGYGPCQSDCWLSNTMAGRQVHGYHTRSDSLPCEPCSWNEDLVKSPHLEPAPPIRRRTVFSFCRMARRIWVNTPNAKHRTLSPHCKNLLPADTAER